MNTFFNNSLLESFHFLRPEWLWVLIPVTILIIALRHQSFSRTQDNWSRYIDAHLLSHLAIKPQHKSLSRRLPFIAFLATAFLILGLAGPSWQRAEIPSYSGGEPVVIVLSLAQSMNANDLSPSRLKRATHKLRDILQRTQGDERGLVVYSDMPFVASPLTSDARIIEQMLPELSTSLMPVLSNRLDLAIEEASGLLQRAGANSGSIVLLTDSMGDRPEASLQAARLAHDSGYSVSVLGAGTAEGATLQTASGQAISSQSGETFLTKLPVSELQQLARAGGGDMASITPDDTDLNRILPESANSLVTAGEAQDFNTDAWVDMGYWLLLIPVVLLPFLFRRGIVFALPLVMIGGMTTQPTPVYANDLPGVGQSQLETPGANSQAGNTTAAEASAPVWDSLWKTPDQQGSEAFRSGDFDKATRAFSDAAWKGAANYRAGNFAEAAQEFASLNNTQEGYNLGNALAKAGNLEGALQAYDSFLENNEDHENAKFNRDLVAKLLEQQKQEQQENQQQDQDQQQDQQNSDSSDQQEQQGQSGQQQAQQQSQADAGDQQDQQGQSGQQQAQQQSQADAGDQQAQSGQQQAQQQSQPDAGDQQQQPGQPGQQQAQSGEQPEAQTQPEGESLLSSLLSDILDGNEDNQAEARNPGAQSPEIDQAVEQELRKVPDDPSGLLRARIRQHYAQLRSTQTR